MMQRLQSFPGHPFMTSLPRHLVSRASSHLSRIIRVLPWLLAFSPAGLILALFALFEKKRNDILRLVENLKRWEG